MKSNLITIALSGLSLLAGLSCYLLATHILIPLRVVLSSNIFTIESIDSRTANATLGLSGIEIEKLREHLGESATITPFRVSNSEIRSADGASFRHLLRLGRDDADLKPLQKALGGLSPLSETQCVDPGIPPNFKFSFLKVDGEACTVVSVPWNPWVLKLLSGRQDLGLISRISRREAYLHPDNIVYRAIVIPKDDASSTEKRVRDALSTFQLPRPSAQLLGAKHILKATLWREMFFQSQRVLIVLILILAVATLASGLIATLSLGLSRGVLQKRQDWIRSTLGELPRIKIARLLFENSKTFCLSLLLTIGGAFGFKFAFQIEDWSCVILEFASIGYLILLMASFALGRILASARLPIPQLMAWAIALQLVAFSVCCITWVSRYENFLRLTASRELEAWQTTVAWRITLDSQLVSSKRWKAELAKVHQYLTGSPEEAAYIYPLPTDQPLGVVLSAPNSPIQTSLVVRTFDTTRTALKQLGLKCTDTGTLSESRMEKGVMLTESVSRALYGKHPTNGASVRYLGAEYQVVGICQDPHWSAVPSVFMFEPVNWAYLLLSSQDGGKDISKSAGQNLLLSSRAWEFSTKPKPLTEYWLNLFLPEAERVALLKIMTGLAFTSTWIGLFWFLASENIRTLPVSAIRLAVGGPIPVVARQMSRPIFLASLIANSLGLGIALAAEAQDNIWSPDAITTAIGLATFITLLELLIIYIFAVAFLMPSAFSSKLYSLLNSSESTRRI